MHTLYNSESFVVVSFDPPGGETGSPHAAPRRGGFEVIDKLARKEIYIEGLLAEQFQQGVQALVARQSGADAESLHAAIDAFIAGYSGLAQQPVLLH